MTKSMSKMGALCCLLTAAVMVGGLPGPPVRAAAALRGAGVTVIIHGWQTDTGEPPWTRAMQDAIINRAGGGRAARITVTGSAGNLAVACDPWDLGLATALSGEVVVRVDWSAVADNLTAGVTAQAVARALAPAILQGQNGEPPLAQLPIHLIGHSRGGGMVYDLAQILGEHGVEVDQVTTLDPHPLTSSDPQPLLGPATIDTPLPAHPWANVLFADNYWQDDAYPEGRYVDGAYNRLWTALPGGYFHAVLPYNLFAQEHQNVHLMYQGTIDPATPLSDGWAVLGPAERAGWYNAYEERGARTGFYYTRIIGVGSRTSTARPVPGGDAVVDGYDAALGGRGARQALPFRAAVWPNVITLDILRGGTSLPGPGPQYVTPGERLQLAYTYRDFGAATVTFYVDKDRNPYNDNNLAVIGTEDLAATGPAVARASVNWDTADLSAPGTYYVYAKITAGSRTRYLYADPAIGVGTGKTHLSDIAGSWARTAIEELVARGAITGYPPPTSGGYSTFRPDEDITRAEFVTVLVKALGLTPKSGPVFADTRGTWAQGYISTAAARGIVSGYDSSRFGPNDPVTREQMTAMAVRAIKPTPVSGRPAFKDAAAIASWARDDVAAAVQAGIVKGYPDGTFRPLAHATRAEAAAVTAGLLKYASGGRG